VSATEKRTRKHISSFREKKKERELGKHSQQYVIPWQRDVAESEKKKEGDLPKERGGQAIRQRQRKTKSASGCRGTMKASIFLFFLGPPGSGEKKKGKKREVQQIRRGKEKEKKQNSKKVSNEKIFVVCWGGG